MKSKVALVKCENYRYQRVLAAARRGIRLVGGAAAFARPGEKILLKPNLLGGDSPERAVTVHPAVFRAAAEIFKETGARLSYGDSPGRGKPDRVAQRAGIKDVAEEMGIPLADFVSGVQVSFGDGLIARQLQLAAGALDCDGIISISKMKTHALTRITGAVKNQFGCIPGLIKAEYHIKMPDIRHFSSVLVDITRYLAPRLYLMDGIRAMEGNGPRGGEPRPMNVLLFSTDPVALDAVFCRLIRQDPAFVPFLEIGRESKLGTYKSDEIEIVGDPIEPLIQPDFKVVRQPPERFITSRYFPSFAKNLISPRPIIHYPACKNCGACVQQCPVTPSAVDWHARSPNEKPTFDYKKCIRCYCCQEICPHRAITVKVPLLGRIIHRQR